MVRRLTDVKISRTLLITGNLLYLLIYLGRYNYSTLISYLVDGQILTKSESGLITSVFFFVYAIGQLIFGMIGDKRSPYKMILLGTSVAALANFVMFFCRTYIPMLMAYTVNALAQSMVFAPLMSIFSTNIMEQHRSKGLNYFTIAAPMSLIIVNLLIILFDALSNYYLIYLFSGTTLLAVSVYWYFLSQKAAANLVAEVREEQPEENIEQVNPLKILWISGMVFFSVSIICRGMIDNGTSTWVPTMLMETYNTTPAFSQFRTMFLSVGSILGSYAGIFVLKKLKCEVKTSIFFFACIMLPLGALLFMEKFSITVSVILLFMVYLFKTAFFQMTNIRVPARFGNIGKASLFSGILNFIAAIGFTLSGYVFGFIAENYGWTANIIAWLSLSALAIIFSLITLPKWRAFLNKNKL